eukprot:CAMPEP_0202866960 /NCGR_PEP_ID=MMETSP1391-20130828/8451_1 /ASSEMBLY_ACC=CAM_ASM_000867 /TAXON_ID=1034604 /ORGANISM="Chlamydomonas leiostraca, Strain SAG 11-49" /LENGTH=595 /DNA_ID=CAMNT_0049546953 /DNA_START=219 /DNA_END=2003 /DNA_ORIENTATION=-
MRHHVVRAPCTALCRAAPLPPLRHGPRRMAHARHGLQPSAPVRWGQHHAAKPAPMQPVKASQSNWNPVEVVKREQGLQSNKLSATLRDKVAGAVEELRFRCTAGDVAARAGVRPQEAEAVLQALAYDTRGTLEVSQEGTIVYELPRDFRTTLTTRSLLLRLAPLGAAASKLGAYLLRVAFGTALIASISVVWLAVIAITSSSRDRDSNRGGGGNYNSYGSYHSGGGPGMQFYFNLTDLLIYLDPNYGATSQERLARGAQLTFVEALFSFVFGDGDPNRGYDSERWSALGQLIQDRGGVVTAEEMAPYLEPPMPAGADADADEAGGWDYASSGARRQRASTVGASGPAYADESFVLPALIRFGGEPVVDEGSGAIVYRFPAFQQSAQGERFRVSASAQRDIPLEESWELTAASGGQLAASVGLGLANIIGVATLSSLLTDQASRYILAAQGLGWIGGLMPALQLYAVAFFAIPAIRWVLYARRNSAIDARNTARLAAARAVNGAGRWLRQKLQGARQLGERRVLRRQDAIYTSDREAGSQLNELAQDEWDKRLGSRGGGSGGGAGSSSSSSNGARRTTRGGGPSSSSGWGDDGGRW